MKTLRTLFVLATIFGSSSIFGQLSQVYPEVYAVDGIPGYTTYRIYAELDNPEDFLSSVFAANGSQLSIGSSSNTIWNSDGGVTTGDALSTGLCGFFPELCYDSFVTIGWVGSTNYLGNEIACGQATTTIASSPSPSVFGDSFGSSIGQNLVVIDGAWFTTNAMGCNDNGYGAGPNNKILLCQITIPSEDNLEYTINVQVFPLGNASNSIFYFGDTTGLGQGDIDGSNMGLVYPAGNCLDEAACNYNSNPGYDENPFICNYECFGCTDSTACNFDSTATLDDGTCTQDCLGCTDPAADNYDSTATTDDGSCIILGCTASISCNYDSTATEDDGSCEYDCLGCTDTTACNYDPEATVDNGSCTSVCDGCTDSTANNYDQNATNDDGSCVYNSDYWLSIEPYFVHDGPLSDVDLTGYTTYRMYVNMVNATDEVSSVFGIQGQPMSITTPDGFWQAELGALLGSNVTPGFFDFFPSLEYDSFVTINMTSNADDGTVNAIDDPSNDWINTFENGGDIVINDNTGGSWWTTTPDINGTPDEQYKVLLAQFTTTSVIEACIHIQIFPEGAQENAIQLELCANSGPMQGCMNSASCNFNPNAQEDDGSCTDTCPGCTDTTASNYEANATEEDGSCLYDGCTDPEAVNYDSTANNLDDSCIYQGCTDPLAFNFDNQANEDDGSCDYDCEGTVVYIDMTDSFGDGWNGATWNVADDMGNSVYTGSLDDAIAGDNTSFGTDIMCLTDGCYTLTVAGGSFDSEIGWSLTGTDGGETSGSSGITSFQIGSTICIMGCTDTEAANYDSGVTLEDGSCEYPGCITEWAANYDSTSNVDDGSCIFDISGYVFYDGNMNGVYDNAGFDFGLPFQLLMLEPSNLLVITDEDGYYSFGVQPSGDYTITAEENTNFPVATTPLSLTINNDDLISTPSFDFGMADDEAFFDIEVDLYPNAVGYPCNGIIVNHSIAFRNMGTETIHGVVQFDYDELFDGYVESFPIDSVVGNSIYMSFQGLMPGEMYVYGVGLITPDFNTMGETLSTTAYVYAMDGEDILAYGEETREMEVTCSWDPNDKMVFPGGYAEPHYILGDQSLDYVVRFQNTGNAPAETVLIRDTIANELDLNSFALVANSHSVLTTIDPVTREVQFLFENIMLPDSTTNEPDSHGLISYTIKPVEGLAAETQFTNTAYIYFDANPAVITNSTWNTIYECGAEGNFSINSVTFCAGDELVAQSTHPFVETFSWELDGDLVSVESTYADFMNEAGEYDLNFIGENPLCATPLSITITVNEVPEAIITEDGAVLSATEGDSWQWYLNGEAIEGETNQTYTINDAGVYTVEVFSSDGCSAISEGVTVTSVDEFISQVAVIYPNPMTSSATLILSEGTYTVTITDAAGRIVKAFENINGGSHNIDRDGLASGIYQMHIATKDQPRAQSLQLIVQ